MLRIETHSILLSEGGESDGEASWRGAWEGLDVRFDLRATAIAGAAGFFAGCAPLLPLTSNASDYANITDPKNGEARFVGSASCVQCHVEIGAVHARSAHANALTAVVGRDGPRFAGDAEDTARRAVARFAAPDGFEWADVPWVLGGFRKGAMLLGVDGFFLTTGSTGLNGVTGALTQYNLAFGPNGVAAGYVAFEADRTEALAFDFATFRRFTTGAVPQDADAPLFFEGRPGFQGTWSEAGVSCEACHGPGGRHFSASGGEVRIERGAIFVDPDGAATCGTCHSNQFDASVRTIATADGFVAPFQQFTELRASGGHAGFSCGVCHESHESLTTNRAAAIRNECRTCHADMNMALHDRAVFTRSDGYTEALTCESCHMSYGVKQYSSADFGLGRVGDTRTHLFRVSSRPVTFSSVVDERGNYQLDADGRAAMAVDRVCLRCHNDAVDGLFSLTVARAAEIGPFLHVNFGP